MMCRSGLTGGRDTLAVRMPAHATTQALCQQAGPLISTSANITGETTCLDAADVEALFGETVYVYPRSFGRRDQRPSQNPCFGQ